MTRPRGGTPFDRATLRHIAVVIVWIYPALLLTSLYTTWVAAWVELGHPPRPSLDDPTSISTWVTVHHRATGALVIGSPAALFGGMGVIAVGAGASRPLAGVTARVLLFVAAWTATILFLGWDPVGVSAWYMD